MSTARSDLIADIGQYTTLLIRAGSASAAAATNTLIDTTLATSAVDIPQNSLIYCVNDASGTANDGRESRVTDYDPTTGTITFFPAWPEATATSDTYQIWEKAVETRVRAVEALDRALTQRCNYWALVPLGLLAGGPCQATTVAGLTAWAATSGTITVTDQSFPYRFGPKYLAFETTGASGGYMRAQATVQHDRIYAIAALLRGASGTAPYLRVYDETNSAVIAINGDDFLPTPNGGWEYHKGTVTIPTTCRLISVQVGDTTISKQIRAGWVAFWATETRVGILPPSVTSETAVGRIFELTEAIDPDFPETWHLNEIKARPEQLGYNRLGVRLKGTAAGGPYFAEVQTFYDALATEAATTDCERVYAAWLGAYELASQIARRQELLHGVKETEPYQRLEMRMMAEANSAATLAARQPFVITRGM